MGVSFDEVERQDWRSCPDCQGTGFWYPEGQEKGVAKCKHTRLVTSDAQRRREELVREYERRVVMAKLAYQRHAFTRKSQKKASMPPPFGVRALLLILNKDERINIPGDLEEEFAEIATKHGARFAKVWYYKQVAGSAWPMIRKGVRWGVWAWIGEWLRQRI